MLARIDSGCIMVDLCKTYMYIEIPPKNSQYWMNTLTVQLFPLEEYNRVEKHCSGIARSPEKLET